MNSELLSITDFISQGYKSSYKVMVIQEEWITMTFQNKSKLSSDNTVNTEL